MNASQHFRTLARYNLWATRKLYESLDALTEDDYRRDAGLFFRSVHGTLNHLLVGEHQLWFRRFAEGVSPRLRLDEEIEPDRARLRERLLDGAAVGRRRDRPRRHAPGAGPRDQREPERTDPGREVRRVPHVSRRR